MSNLRVAKTVWPWEAADAAKQVPVVAASPRKRAVIEALVMVTVGLVLHIGFHKVWVPRFVWTMAGLTLIGGLFYAPLYHGIHRGALWLGKITGIGMTWLLLVPFFFIVFPAGRVMFAMSGKDPLNRGYDKARTSYWHAREPVKDLKRYKNQF